MKKTLLSLMFAALGFVSIQAEIITIDGIDYQTNVITDRDIGPGIRHLRLRIPDYPLNVNILTMDLNNPYNRIETTQAYEELCRTERLADAYTRQMTDEKRPIAGANANFWCVSTQYPWCDLLIGATFNGNLRNGQIITETNAYSDQWDGGPTRTGVVAVDTDKTIWIGQMYYKGYIKNEKISTPEIIQVNKVVRENEIGLYNSFYGRDKSFQPVTQYTDNSGNSHFSVVEGTATEIYLNLTEGQEWMAGKSMECIIGDIKYDAGTGTLGDYDLCLVACGGYKDVLAPLAVGDVVSIDINWSTEDGTTPIIEQLIGGNAMVMVNGEMTTRNDDESYNSQVYSRCAYGSSADGKTLYVIVIDRSTDSSYGTSAGCNTRVMCQIIQHYGCTDLCNMDAGGSAQMMIGGEVINTTTEGTPRAVANGWMLYSIAPQDDEIARLEFDAVELMAPSYSTFSPVILGYNQYGDLIDENVQGFTLSCDENIGTCDGSDFIAGGEAATGNLTATYNGVSVTKSMTIVSVEPTIRIKPILIDAAREYTMEVTATIDETIYTYDPSKIAWSVDDNTVADIDASGVLRGASEGTTNITGRIDDLEDGTEVTVEIADAPKLYITDFTGWTISRPSGISDYALSEDGVISFTYGSPRDAYIQIAKSVTYYSLPDKLWISFNSSIPLRSLSIDVRSREQTRSNLVEILPTDGDLFEAGESYTVEIPMSEIGDTDDLMTFPITLSYIRFYMEVSTANQGNHTIKITELSSEYNNYTSGIESVAADKKENTLQVYPNPVSEGMVTIKATAPIESISLFSISGAEVLRTLGNGMETETLNVGSLAAGIYFVKVSTSDSAYTTKLIIK